MRLKFSTIFGSFLLIAFLSSCSPSVLDVTLYTTDIEAANEGEVFEVPVRASFTMYSDDDGELETAKKHQAQHHYTGCTWHLAFQRPPHALQ